MKSPTISQGTGRTRFLSCCLLALSALLVLPAVAGCQEAQLTPSPVTQATPPPTTAPSTPTSPPTLKTTTPATVPSTPAPRPTVSAVTPTPTVAQDFRLEIIEPEDESIVAQTPIRVSGSAALDAIVSVNGNIVDVGDNGAFSVGINLLEGPNLLEIIATDSEGNAASQILTVIYLP